MSTQQVSTTPMKGSRNSNRRQQRKNHTPASQAKSVMLTTPPSSPPRIASPGEVLADGTPGAYNGDYNGSRKKNGTRSIKKNRENTRPSNPTSSIGAGHRHTSSQPSIASPPSFKDSPHYAGPTFHASPAPSALPMPSFFSKSVPDSGLPPSLETENELDEESAPELTPSKPKARVARGDHESTPLDFLFKAAIDARSNPQQSPEASSKSTGPAPDSKIGQRPDSASNGIFSLELESSEQIVSDHSTPVSSYKDRMNALMSDGSPHSQRPELDDAQRRLKTQELKHLLLNPRPQRPASASPHLKGPVDSYFPDKGLGHIANTPLHASSGPPTPVSYNGHIQQNNMPGSSQKFHKQHYHTSLQAGPQNTHQGPFRREYSPYASPINAVRTNNPGPYSQSPFRGVPSPTRYQSPAAFDARLQANPSSHTPELDTKKMEDDLRRILKLDMATGIQSNGVQSSLA